MNRQSAQDKRKETNEEDRYEKDRENLRSADGKHVRRKGKRKKKLSTKKKGK